MRARGLPLRGRPLKTHPAQTVRIGRACGRRERDWSPWRRRYAGVPDVSIPCGLASDAMPAGLQLVGRPGDDVSLLHVAQWCEKRLAFRDLPGLLA